MLVRDLIFVTFSRQSSVTSHQKPLKLKLPFESSHKALATSLPVAHHILIHLFKFTTSQWLPGREEQLLHSHQQHLRWMVV